MVELPRRRRVAALLTAAAATLALAAGPGAPASADPVPTVPDLGPTSFTGAGPYGVGERTLTLPSGSKLEVWYPARKADVRGKPMGTYDVVDWLPDFLQAGLPPGTSVAYPSGGVRGVPAAAKRFPLVVFSHGYAGFRTQSSFLTAALASWGFVVAAPDHNSRSLTQVLLGPKGTTTDVQDLRQTLTLMASKSRKKGWLHGRVDMTHVGAVGHSAGGRAVENLALVDKRVDTFIGMAGASVGALDQEAPDVPDKPGLLLAATDDGIVGLDKMQSAYDAMASPKRLVLVGGAGHLVFSDLCEIGAGDGGLLAVAAAVGITVPPALVPLATDGCLPPALSPPDAWPAIDQVVIAQLRHVLGYDRSAAGLTGLTDAFPGIITGRSESVP
ncbi:MAG: dienelactone hydrolase family protein [Nocardioides sp.]|nr:dienelactone hydrolase family protein [Nocardioidaceae bacterium]MCB8955019.1 dienelactone hydrolase family protein [Nocardioides sp.]